MVGGYGYGGPQGYSYGSYPGGVYDYTSGPLSYPGDRGGFGGGTFQNFPGQPSNGGFHFGEQQIQGPGYSGFASDQGALETATSTGPTGYGTVSSAVGFDNANGWLTAAQQAAAPYAAAASYGYQNPPQQGCYGYQGNPSATASVLGGYQSGAVAGPYSYAVATNDGGAGAAWAAANGQFPSFSVDLSGAYAAAVAQSQAGQAQAAATTQPAPQQQAAPFTYNPSQGAGTTYGAAATYTPTSTTAPSGVQSSGIGPATPTGTAAATATSAAGSSASASGTGASATAATTPAGSSASATVTPPSAGFGATSL